MEVAQILEAKKCGDIFPKNEAARKKLYRDLLKKFHPDIYKGPEVDSISSQLNSLYERAAECDELGIWEMSNVVQFNPVGKKPVQLKYLGEKPFGLGTCYISATKVVYEMSANCGRFKENAVKNMSRLPYKSPEIKAMMERFLPVLHDQFTTTDGKHVIVCDKTSEVYSLVDVLEYFGGAMPPVHVAWVTTRLLNLCCYLKMHGLSLNGICLTNIFVSTLYHSVIPMGGWWAAVEEGEKLIGVDSDVYEAMPLRTKNTSRGSVLTDIECTRAVARKLLGTKYYEAPGPFRAWIDGGNSGDPIKELENWETAREASFGKRKFIPLEITDSDIYKK